MTVAISLNCDSSRLSFLPSKVEFVMGKIYVYDFQGICQMEVRDDRGFVEVFSKGVPCVDFEILRTDLLPIEWEKSYNNTIDEIYDYLSRTLCD